MHEETSSLIPATEGWVNTTGPDDPPGTVLPDGCMDIMWFDDELMVCGADTSARAIRPTAGTRVGLRFAPGHLPLLLGIPAAALVDQRVPLADLVRTGVGHRAMGQAEEALVDTAAVATLERLARALGAGRSETAFEDAVTAHALAGTPVAGIADDLGLGPRQLHRRCLDAFGYGPKVLARVLRLQRAVALGRQGRPPADVAAVAGYADQSHLAREVRTLTGSTWTDL